MIAVDTSAIIAILKNEPAADRCAQALLADEQVVISAGTLAEALIVAARRNLSPELATLIDDVQWRVEAVTQTSATRAADAYNRWGKGMHPAGLNYGDCFAYELASRMNCPLLYVGDDFAKTDIQSAL